jgi:hypothetical protein
MAVGRRPMRIVRDEPPTGGLAAAAVARREKERATAASVTPRAMAAAPLAPPQPMAQRDPLVRNTAAEKVRRCGCVCRRG